MTGRRWTPAEGQRPKRTQKKLSTSQKAVRERQNKEIGERIKHVRIEILGFHRRLEFAERLGVTRGAVGNWELGQGINRDNLQRIATAYEISHNWLVTGEGLVRGRPALILENKLELLPPEEQQSMMMVFTTILDNRLDELRKRHGAGKKKP